MGSQVSRCDYEWSYTDEPHATRRKLILKKYPQIKKLMTIDKRFKWIVIAIVFIQLITIYILSHFHSLWLFMIMTYCFTGVLNHTLTLAIHEISHNQAFGPNRPLYNKLFGIFANLPIGFPMSVTFKKYHLEHHRYQGDDVIDTDIPSRFEAKIFTTTARKFIWVLLQPLFYGLRPFFVYPKAPNIFEFLNLVIQLLFDIVIAQTLGYRMVLYMIVSSLIAMGLHPVAGHFISEHYIMFDTNKKYLIEKAKNLKQLKNENEITADDELSKCEFVNGVYAHNGLMLIPETCSYYGPLNWITFNVGYHVEHHDFPSIPGTLLPQVRKIAPEFYDSLHSHNSWTNVIYRYIIDPNIGPYSRVKRPHQPKNNKPNED
ncbi:sphingolipid delta(4)-desaturase DES1-like protein [Euroglyphus maynei]|uniref:sphingolipid 4-desaturase n=1 Tax=Euroglyphus maynei TaxID=6958 RepID=A0A1Y3BBU5_EURMA|nr:sphingolipid delta(4)-desaturase DES1-like protein [Euroglyphus maynei]